MGRFVTAAELYNVGPRRTSLQKEGIRRAEHHTGRRRSARDKGTKVVVVDVEEGTKVSGDRDRSDEIHEVPHGITRGSWIATYNEDRLSRQHTFPKAPQVRQELIKYLYQRCRRHRR